MSLVRDQFNTASERTWLDRVKRLLVTTPLEIALAGIALTTVGGAASYHHENQQRGEIPLAYSQVVDLPEAAQTPLTSFYSTNNDAVMMVFQANNEAFGSGYENSDFARALEDTTGVEENLHDSLDNLAGRLPDEAADALETLSDIDDAATDLARVEATFDAAWSAYHDDHYHTEIRSSTSCTTSSNGTQNCTTTYYPVQVYDWTDHTYTYNAQQGQLALDLLDLFLAEHPGISVEQALNVIHDTSPENERIISESRARELDGRELTQAEYLELANTWATGSNFVTYEPRISEDYEALPRLADVWRDAMRTAHSESYRTYSRGDSGPTEYQYANHAGAQAGAVSDNAHNIVDGIRFGGLEVPRLNNLIHQYIDATLYNGEGNPDELRDEIMQTAGDIYDQSYEQGFDIHPFKWMDVILLTLLSAAVGIGVGVGVNALVSLKTDEWMGDGDGYDYRPRGYGSNYRRDRGLSRY